MWTRSFSLFFVVFLVALVTINATVPSSSSSTTAAAPKSNNNANKSNNNNNNNNVTKSPPLHLYERTEFDSKHFNNLTLDELRNETELFLRRHNAHTKAHSGLTLLDHLMGTFYLLSPLNLPNSVVAAGALHSVYSTNAFRNVTIQATPENRSMIRRAFGQYTEKLVFLFHATNRPKAFEYGDMINRHTKEPIEIILGNENNMTANKAIERSDKKIAWMEFYHLRLIEAANLIEQTSEEDLEERYPVLYATWMEKQRVENLRNVMLEKPAAAVGGLTRVLNLRIFLHHADHDSEIGSRTPIPVVKNVYGQQAIDFEFLTNCLISLFGTDDLHPSTKFGFYLRGEEKYGMTITPLSMLSNFLNTRYLNEGFSSSPVLDIVFAMVQPTMAEKRLPVEAIPINNLLAHMHDYDALRALPDSHLLSEQVRVNGFAVITVNEEDQHIVEDACKAFETFTTLPVNQTKKARYNFEDQRMVGYVAHNQRKYMQLRLGMDRPDIVAKFSAYFPAKVHEPNYTDLFNRMIKSTKLLDKYAKLLFYALAGVAGLPAEHVFNLAEIRSPHCDGFGPGVHRIYRYTNESIVPTNLQTGTHSDLGILTLMPRSNRPSLAMFHPQTFDVLEPENGLGPRHWVVFPADTIQYLTRNYYQAPIHWVFNPTLSKEDSSARYSMPYFLRADPEEMLRPIEQQLDEETMHQEQHGENEQGVGIAADGTVEAEVDNINKDVLHDKDSNTENDGAAGVDGGKKKTNKVKIPADMISTRIFTYDHSDALRPWRLNSGSDF